MSLATVHGVTLNYEVFGDSGPWVALSPGGRRSMAELVNLARRLAADGYRVLLHDRRNCGASDVSIDGDGAEYEIAANDLYELLKQFDALPAFVGGSSSGCRLSVVMALRRPEAVRGLLLWRMTGGHRACERLTEKYYGMYIKAAQAGGMAAVCDTPEFRKLIAARPSNRERLMAMDPDQFIAVMQRWNTDLVQGADLPMIGASERELRGLDIPVCVIPGNDFTHSRLTGEAVAALLPRCELHSLGLPDADVDVSPDSEWEAQVGAMHAIFLAFMKQHQS